MAPRTEIEFVILRLRFMPVLTHEYPMTQCITRKHPPRGFLNRVRVWFDKVLAKELSQIPYDLIPFYCEWIIKSDDVKLFTIKSCLFDHFTVFFGEHSIHWVFNQKKTPGVRIEGCSPVTVSYCSCCLDSQYIKITESIKSDINKDCKCELCTKLLN